MPAPILQIRRGNAGIGGTIPALRQGEPAISLNNFDLFIGIDSTVANNKFFGSHRYWNRENGNTSLKLNLVDKTGLKKVSLKSPDTLQNDVSYTFPATPIENAFLKTNSLGILEWSTELSSFLVGVATFTDTTPNILGNPNSGAVQIYGGLGVGDSVSIGGSVHINGGATIQGNLVVNGNTTQISTNDLTINDRTITLGFQTGGTPTTTTWDLGVLMNYGDVGVAKTAGVIWKYNIQRFVFSSNSNNPLSIGTSEPNLSVSSYAPIEIGSLWINDCAGQSQVISCTGTERHLENIVLDLGIY